MLFISNDTLEIQVISFWGFSGYELQFHIPINEDSKIINNLKNILNFTRDRNNFANLSLLK